MIGGGIAGLSAAWRLRDRDVLLLEAGDRLGGRIRSDERGSYWFNIGAHLFPAPGTLVDAVAPMCRGETGAFADFLGLLPDAGRVASRRPAAGACKDTNGDASWAAAVDELDELRGLVERAWSAAAARPAGRSAAA